MPDKKRALEFFSSLTLSGRFPELSGSVIFSCSDDAVEFVARNHDELSHHFHLERNRPGLQLELLNKKRTLELAKKASVPTPAFFAVNHLRDIQEKIAGVRFPVILKPVNTLTFRRRFGMKYIPVKDISHLMKMAAELLADDIEFMVSEMIPGPDSANCSYYSYRDESGTELLSLTKRCIRRHPMNEGAGTYQVTKRLPDVEKLGKRFFDALDYRGIGNLEFKRDARDGQLNVIECNNRFTAVQEQLVQAGVDAALIAYRDITGQEGTAVIGCEERVAIWSPRQDLQAFGQVKAFDDSSWLDWWRSMDHRKLVFPIFSVADPMPFLASFSQRLVAAIARRFRRLAVVLRPRTWDKNG